MIEMLPADDGCAHIYSLLCDIMPSLSLTALGKGEAISSPSREMTALPCRSSLLSPSIYGFLLHRRIYRRKGFRCRHVALNTINGGKAFLCAFKMRAADGEMIAELDRWRFLLIFAFDETQQQRCRNIINYYSSLRFCPFWEFLTRILSPSSYRRAGFCWGEFVRDDFMAVARTFSPAPDRRSDFLSDLMLPISWINIFRHAAPPDPVWWFYRSIR